MRVLLAGLLAVAAGSACAVNPDPVPLGGAPSAIAALEGEWVGDYESRESGRSGSIFFRIEAGRDTAFGDVIMTPIPTDRATAAFPQPAAEAVALRVAFVNVSTARVRGKLVEYDDPGCTPGGCRLTTTFEGTVDGDEITGTFTSVHHPGNVVQKGTWRARRR